MDAKIRRGLQFLLVACLIAFSLGLASHFSVRAAVPTARTCGYYREAYQGLKLSELSRQLEGSGLLGHIHGAVLGSQQFVLSVQDPDNFFDRREFSLLPGNGATAEALSQLKRHDRVCLRGRLLPNPSPQPHVLVEAVTVLDSWSGLAGFPADPPAAPLPAEFGHQNSLVGKVHAVGGGGRVLVVESEGAVVPVFVEDPQQAEGLFRGDIIRLWYRLQPRPSRPTHLRLDLDREKSVEVLDAIASWHGQETMLSGRLVKFPASPQIAFDVYALEVETQGVKRYFTLLNGESPEKFQRIRDELAQIWDAHLKTVRVGRNLLVNPAVVVEARGRINVVSPQQANPQILLNGAGDLRVEGVRP